MTTLVDRASISRLAGILHAAMAMGPQLWNGGNDRRGELPQASSLTHDLMALFSQLNQAGASYLLVGGVAMLKYIEGRNTDDVDLIIAAEALEHIPKLKVEDRTSETARATFRALRVDLLFTSNAVFKLVQQKHATTHRFAEIVVPCATVEGLVLLKLYALPSLYRHAELQRAALYEGDITMLCQRHAPDIAPLLSAIRPHVSPGEFAELQRISAEIQARIQRMERGHREP